MNVSLDKKYRTRDGREVLLHAIKLHNSAGREVTFPVKGTIITTLPSGRKRYTYTIWKLDGSAGAISHLINPEDLMEVK